jgi:hypothetical protein
VGGSFSAFSWKNGKIKKAKKAVTLLTLYNVTNNVSKDKERGQGFKLIRVFYFSTRMQFVTLPGIY